MSKEHLVLDLMEQTRLKREARRGFIRRSAGFMAGAAAATGMLSACGDNGHSSTSSAGATPVNGSAQQDLDVLNFALNLEYLEAQFYSFAATGAGLPASMLTGTGTQGAVTGGAMVNFMGDTLTNRATAVADGNSVVVIAVWPSGRP